jgi:small subunit ribosomal protein S17
MQKTVVVSTVRYVKDTLTSKKVKRTKKYKVHDEEEICHVGDVIEAQECRPLSRDKHFILTRIVQRGKSGLAADLANSEENEALQSVRQTEVTGR